MITREQAIAEHRKMWHWIADETRKQKRCVEKRDYIELVRDKFPELLYHNGCFCCLFTKYICSHCPIDWDSSAEEYMCQCSNLYEEELCNVSESTGYFAQWVNAKADDNYEKAAEVAETIAELPEKKE